MTRMLDALVDRWGEGRLLGAWAPSRAHDEALRSWWAGLQRMGASPGAGGGSSPSPAERRQSPE